MRTERHRRAACVIWLACIIGRPVTTPCQTPTVQNLIVGQVRGPAGRPIEGAIVRLTSDASDSSSVATTRTDGRYKVLCPDVGEQYTLAVRAIGYSPVRLNVAKSTTGRSQIVDIELALPLHTLAAVVTNGVRPPATTSAGDGTHAYSANAMRRLPIDPRNPLAAAGLVPGVFASGHGFSVNGQGASSMSVTVDGTVANLSPLPPEAIASVSISPNDFDPAHARSSGVSVGISTLGGSAVPHGAIDAEFRSHALELGNPSSSSNTVQTAFALGGGYGGPLIRDHLFAFGAVDLTRSTANATSLQSATPSALQQLGIASDSVARLLSILHTLGVPTSLAKSPIVVTQDALLAFGRLDYAAAARHVITLTGQLLRNDQQGAAVGAMALPTQGTTNTVTGAGTHLTISSQFGQSFVNTAGVAIATQEVSTIPLVRLPAGSVTIGSTLVGGAGGYTTLTFGGSGSFPTKISNNSFAADELLSWLSPDARHRVSFGGTLTLNETAQEAGANALGSFSFNSLADLAAGTPASFVRTTVPLSTRSGSLATAVFGADQWMVGHDLVITYGLRADATRAEDLPQYDPAIDSLFRRRTDRIPAPWSLDPSAGLRWVVGQSRTDSITHPPVAIITGGVSASAANAAGAGNGSLGRPQTTLICTGLAAPTPQWSVYGSNLNALPASCINGVNTATAGARPAITVLDPRDPAPHAWSASLGVDKPLSSRVVLQFGLSGTAGAGVIGTTDLNLNPVPQFTLSNEGNRPIYAPAGTIDPTTGTVSLLGSRLYSEFGQVLSVTSRLHQIGGTATIAVTATAPNGQLLQLSYAIVGSRQQAYFPTPLTPTWAHGGQDGKQQVMAVISQPIGHSVDMGIVASIVSGDRYTPQVSTDITGTGMPGTPAFVFDPATTSDPAIAAAMRTLLTSAPANARACLHDQLRRLADLNSCVGPWQPGLDASVNVHPSWFGLNGRLVVTFAVTNILTGLDALVHGPDHLAGWGFPGAPDPLLLHVDGFDPTRKEFLYTINPRFGTGTASRAAQVTPGQLVIRGRFSIGAGGGGGN